MSRVLAVLCVGIVANAAHAVQNATVNWDIETTGSASNGCGFDNQTYPSSTDYSTGASGSPFALVVSYSGSGDTLTYVSGSHTPATTDKGNIIAITGSQSGMTNGGYEITNVVVGTSWTVDRAPGTASNSSVSIVIGGPCDQPNTAFALTDRGEQQYWMKSGTYSLGPQITTASMAGQIYGVGSLTGYYTTHGDTPNPFGGTDNRPHLSLNASGTLLTILTSSYNYFTFRNLIVDCNSQAGSIGISANSEGVGIDNDKVENCEDSGATYTGGSVDPPMTIRYSEFTNNCQSGATNNADIYDSGGTAILLLFSYIHDSACNALYFTTNGYNTSLLMYNVFANHLGAAVDTIEISSTAAQQWLIRGNVFYDCGRDCIRFGYPNLAWDTIQNNVFYLPGQSATGYGFNWTGGFTSSEVSPSWPLPNTHPNAYPSSSGANNYYIDTTQGDVLLTASPFNNPCTSCSSGQGDWGINDTSGGGAALRGAGFPGSFSFSTSFPATGQSDFGAIQVPRVVVH